MALLELERAPAPRAPRRLALAGTRPRILLCTEGTYPYVMGGVSSWCDLLVGGLDEFDWQVLPIVAPGKREPLYTLPPHAREVGRIEVWSEDVPRGGALRRREPARRAAGDARPPPDRLGGRPGRGARRVARAAAGTRPTCAARSARAAAGAAFLAALEDVLAERIPEAGTPPALDLVEAAQLYQTLYWVARTAAVPTPETDVLHVTAAGWSAIPAVVHKALHGTPMVLTEHGVYVREAYLAPVAQRRLAGRALRRHAPGPRPGPLRPTRAPTSSPRSPTPTPTGRWASASTRTRSSSSTTACASPPSRRRRRGTQTVVSVGRIDPLKDIHTMLRVAAETLRAGARTPSSCTTARSAAGEEAYGRSCLALHEQLGLGERFRFMGRTTDPNGVVRDADVVLMTSISEGLPMSILEAMGEARPVVSTGVGGVPDVVTGCGVVTPPGDDHGLAMAVAMLLRNPELAWRLGPARPRPARPASSTRPRASTATASCCTG